MAECTRSNTKSPRQITKFNHLEQIHFNSLDAQREACEAYIASQAGEGWSAMPQRYDDGGYSGGSMNRPGLQRLLTDISSGLIDVVVVYKIDRLTRSLPDFARIVEQFDARTVSFVSVTQAFNTSSSMGRLTLNVLLSFAQFEREITGERIRDKIAASKAKGLWMGGLPPLGYDAPAGRSRVLRVNKVEAATVRYIFQRYLEIGSVYRLLSELEEQGFRSKQRINANGEQIGGRPFSRGAMFHLLRNRVYTGQIVHKDRCYEGQHEGIVEQAVFDGVQASLGEQRRKQPGRRTHSHPLSGKLFDQWGARLVRTHSRGSRGRTYRYYVSAHLQQGRRGHVPADRYAVARVDAAVAAALLRLSLLVEEQNVLKVIVWESGMNILLPVQLEEKVITVLEDGESLSVHGEDASKINWTIPCTLKPRGGRARVEAICTRQSKRDPVFIAALQNAHRIVCFDPEGTPTLSAMPNTRYEVRLARLALLAPSIQKMIVEGRQPAKLRLEDLVRSTIPLCWIAQEELISRLVASNSMPITR